MTTFHLDPLPGFHPFPGPVVLVIMDGVGLGKRDESDGVFLAYTPVLDELFAEPLFARLRAHGKAVGLPVATTTWATPRSATTRSARAGSSPRARKLVNDAIASGAIFEAPPGRRSSSARRRAGRSTSSGCCRTATSTATSTQLFALLDRCAEEGVARVRVHPLLDGRDVRRDERADLRRRRSRSGWRS